MSGHLVEALLRNVGNTLTPELVAGLLRAAEHKPDNRIDTRQFEPMEYRGYVFAAEDFEAALPELKPLHAMQWEEIDERNGKIPMNPDYAGYIALNRAGRSLQFTVRKDGELVGQALVRFGLSMHTRTMVGNEDTFYMRPDHRGGFTMLRFVRYMAACAAAMGVREMRTSSKLANKSYLLMQRAGFTPCALQLVLLLEDGHENQVTQ
jgi:L-amino acid N-acyltransferase YncA